MRPEVTYTPWDTSLREHTCDIITFAQFEERNILTKTRSNVEISDKFDDKSIMTMDSGDESYRDLISTEMLEDIHYRSQTYPNVNRRESRYKIYDHIKQRKSE